MMFRPFFKKWLFLDFLTFFAKRYLTFLSYKLCIWVLLMSNWCLVVKVKKNHSFEPTGSMSFKEKRRFPHFYLIAILILWSDFSNQSGTNGQRDSSKVIMSQIFPPIVATFPNPAGSCSDWGKIGPTLTSVRLMLKMSKRPRTRLDRWKKTGPHKDR